MTGKLTTLIAATAIAGSLTAATASYAQEAQPPSQPPSTQGMMGDHPGDEHDGANEPGPYEANDGDDRQLQPHDGEYEQVADRIGQVTSTRER
jgi:hypothetical protein